MCIEVSITRAGIGRVLWCKNTILRIGSRCRKGMRCNQRLGTEKAEAEEEELEKLQIAATSAAPDLQTKST